MNILLSGKGGDVTSWRGVEDFAAAYRRALLDRAASGRYGNAETVFAAASAALETAISTHGELLKRLELLIGEISPATSTDLKGLTSAFYDDLYRHFGHFRSPPAFYQLSMAFLSRASAAISARAAEQLEAAGDHLPEMALIAVGPAGRLEYSPFCRLQILLVHGGAAAQTEGIALFCDALHTGFESAGIAVDPEVTPRNPSWRGTLPEWRQRSEDALQAQADDALIDLCRLVDQYPLQPAEGLARGLKETGCAALRGNRPALSNLIGRMTSLSNGLGLMGGLRLERSGDERGMFNLLVHGLLPLSAALSALALIKESPADGSCERIRDLLRSRELDVELAERMLAAWHSLNDLRLRREQSLQIGGRSDLALFLNPDELTFEQRQALKETLETVAAIQRHVEIIFSGMGE